MVIPVTPGKAGIDLRFEPIWKFGMSVQKQHGHMWLEAEI